MVQDAVPAGIVTTTVAFLFPDEGNAAKKSDSEGLAAVHVAVVQDWAEVRGALNAIARVIRLRRANFFMGCKPRERIWVGRCSRILCWLRLVTDAPSN